MVIVGRLGLAKFGLPDDGLDEDPDGFVLKLGPLLLNDPGFVPILFTPILTPPLIALLLIPTLIPILLLPLTDTEPVFPVFLLIFPLFAPPLMPLMIPTFPLVGKDVVPNDPPVAPALFTFRFTEFPVFVDVADEPGILLDGL